MFRSSNLTQKLLNSVHGTLWSRSLKGSWVQIEDVGVDWRDVLWRMLRKEGPLWLHRVGWSLLWILWRNFGYYKLGNCNIDILERFQSKVLRIITDAPWYVPNTAIRRDLRVFSVRQEVRNYSVTYRHRLDDHPNRLAKSLFQEPAPNRRLKRCYPADVATRF